MKFKHSLMHNNFTRSDMQSVSKLLKKKYSFNTSFKSKNFELKWSKYSEPNFQSCKFWIIS